MTKKVREPRFDLLTNEEIKFKSKEQYEGSFYCNRKNLIKHFKQIDKEEIVKITKEILNNRIKNKGIKYAPCTVECKSWPIPAPSPAFIQSLGLDYNEICKECGLEIKYNYGQLVIPPNFKLTNFIIIDSREQKPLKLDVKTKVTKLDFSDYALSEDLTNSISIEKKSGNDFIGTLSKGWERFLKEFIRSEKANANVLILVQEILSDMLSFNYLPQFFWTKCNPSFTFAKVRELLQSFPNIQIVFVTNKESAAIAKFVLSYGKDLFKYDIQYLYEMKQLKGVC